MTYRLNMVNFGDSVDEPAARLRRTFNYPNEDDEPEQMDEQGARSR